MSNNEVEIYELITRAIEAGTITKEQLALMVGHRTTSVVSAFASGELRVPLDKASIIADAIGVHRGTFFKLCLRQYLSAEAFEQFEKAFSLRAEER